MNSLSFHCSNSCTVVFGFLVIVINIQVYLVSCTEKLPQIALTEDVLKHHNKMFLQHTSSPHTRKEDVNPYEDIQYTSRSYTSSNIQGLSDTPSAQSKLPDTLAELTSTYNLQSSGYRPATSDHQKRTGFKIQRDSLRTPRQTTPRQTTPRQTRSKQTIPIPFNFATDQNTASGYSHSMTPRERAFRARKARDERWLRRRTID